MKYTYDEYLADIRHLYDTIFRNKIQYDLIVGVQRGGLIPAVHLSNLMGVPMQTIQWSIKDNMREGSNSHLICNKEKNVLLVDDILDNGNTIYQLQERYWKMHTAVLIYNVANQYSIVPTYTGRTINRETAPEWIDFWWEK